MTAFDLEELELAYSPQYGSAKDPVNMLGFVAAGMLRGDHPQTTSEQLSANSVAPVRPLVLDVRTSEEFATGHIPDAVSLPLDELRSRLEELPRERPIVTYCEVGQRGYLATRILNQSGYSAVNLSGGFRTYQAYRSTGVISIEPTAASDAMAAVSSEPKCACGNCKCN